MGRAKAAQLREAEYSDNIMLWGSWVSDLGLELGPLRVHCSLWQSITYGFRIEGNRSSGFRPCHFLFRLSVVDFVVFTV